MAGSEGTRPVVLVTGGAGYVGSHTCKMLAGAGYLPVVYDTLERGNAWSVRWGPLEQGSLMDGDRLRGVIRNCNPVGVIHFAAYTYVGESVADPLMYYRNNVLGTVSLARAMMAEGVGRLVFSSTCATYGIPTGVPIDEATPQVPINPYGQSKLLAEQALALAGAAGGLSTVALRYFNAAGADPDGEIGEAHDPETHLIPLALAAARGTAPPLTVFGTDHDTPDGTCIRDYVHVNDLASAHLAALGHRIDEGGFFACNLGTGTGTSVRELIALTEEVTGRPVPHSYGPRREGDPAALVADRRLAHSALGWEPRLSDPRNILQTAWTWMQRQDDVTRSG
ncbi:MAG: UDP-glucose 4-epimerase GalE [Rubellimicrobium sp.]|nr:UDP-glucose 4-epimerase GalE [Rubellimicrobium sp.]